MSKSNCETIRRQIEEVALGESYSADVSTHLSQCRACEEFETEQTNLRRLVGSLGTVQAPSDFDFRLRARLTNQTLARSWFRWTTNPLAATLATLLLFAGVIGTVSYVHRRNSQPTVVADNNKNPVAPIVTPVAPVVGKPSPRKTDEVVADKRDEVKPIVFKPTNTLKPKRTLASADFSSAQATTFGGSGLVSPSTVFPIDASTQPMKVSLDDGRGNARTISLPGVSFGSQRVVTASQYAAKGIW